MTREETVKFIYDLLKKHSVKVNEVDVIPISSCIALVDDLIEHENDILKEFVEWYKKVLEQDYDDKGTRAIVNMVHELKNDYWFYHGQCEAIQRLMSLLDKDLEKFLEEKEK